MGKTRDKHSENVRVAVRCRPFNEREKQLSSVCCLKMEGDTTIITHPQTGASKSFTFDYSYWSFDEKDPHYASQETVFADVGADVLEAAWEGYNVSLFAYGQTGTGKSFSMVGPISSKNNGQENSHRGIVPRVCQSIFEGMAERKDDKNVTFKVEASMLEIYNEKVRDLFANPGKSLKVRTHPTTGPYVEGVFRCACKSFDDIITVMEKGTLARTIHATNMNATSSRAHTIVEIILTQTMVDKKLGTAKDVVSRLNLVDLAGSERLDTSKAEGDRLKEGAMINLSLSTLGKCIATLAEINRLKSNNNETFNKVHVPYRDSVLTLLLKESLGGNAKTIMIAALSPASCNYEETLGTLRYVDRAKHIKNRAIINEDANEKLIRELREEVERLRSLAQGGATAYDPREVRMLREQLQQNELMIEEMNKSWEEKLRMTESMMNSNDAQFKNVGVRLKENQDTPQLINLNEDPQISECLIYFIPAGTTRVGTGQADPPNDIQLQGLSIKAHHCTLVNEGGKVTIEPGADAKVFVDGNRITGPVTLLHSSRVVLGTNHIFRFHDPVAAAELRAQREKAIASGEAINTPQVIDWAFAQKELAAAQINALTMANNEEFRRKEEEMRREHERQLAAMEERFAAEKEAQLSAELEALKAKALEEMAAKARALAEQERLIQEKKNEIESKQAQAQQQEIYERMMREQKAAFEKMMREQLEAQRAELERQQAVAQETKRREMEEQQALEEASMREDAMRQAMLDEAIGHMVQLINEANDMSAEMGRGVTFEVRIVTHTGGAGADGGSRRINSPINELLSAESEVAVAVTFKDGSSATWDADKFSNRVFIMREQFQAFLEDPTFEVAFEDDPFYDPSEVQLLGSCLVFLEALCHLLETDHEPTIVDYRGAPLGQLAVEIKPCGPDGSDNFEDVDSPRQLIGRRLDVLVDIARVSDLTTHCIMDVHVKYKFFNEPPTVTETCKQVTRNPTFNFRRQHTFEHVSEELFQYLMSDAILFEVYGKSPDVKDEDRVGSLRKRPLPGARTELPSIRATRFHSPGTLSPADMSPMAGTLSPMRGPDGRTYKFPSLSPLAPRDGSEHNQSFKLPPPNFRSHSGGAASPLPPHTHSKLGMSPFGAADGASPFAGGAGLPPKSPRMDDGGGSHAGGVAGGSYARLVRASSPSGSAGAYADASFRGEEDGAVAGREGATTPRLRTSTSRSDSSSRPITPEQSQHHPPQRHAKAMPSPPSPTPLPAPAPHPSPSPLPPPASAYEPPPAVYGSGSGVEPTLTPAVAGDLSHRSTGGAHEDGSIIAERQRAEREAEEKRKAAEENARLHKEVGANGCGVWLCNEAGVRLHKAVGARLRKVVSA
eukprot:jgi/Mesvir1/23843/Mv10646-RA.2